MTEIEQTKKLMSQAKGAVAIMTEISLLASLITTIESQALDIEKWKKEAFANHPTQWAYDQACAALNKKTEQIESLQEENKRLDIAAHTDVSLGNTVCEMHAEIESQKKMIDEQYQVISTANIWNNNLKDEITSQKEEIKRQREAIEESFEWISPSSYAYELLKKSLQEGEK